MSVLIRRSRYRWAGCGACGCDSRKPSADNVRRQVPSGPRFPAPKSQDQGGFTLLEVLAAMVLLALLLVGVYSGVRTATHAVRSGTAAVARIDQIRSAQQFLRRELAQSLIQPIAQDPHGQNIYFQGSAHQMRYAAPLPGYLGKLGVQLQQLSLVDDGKDDGDMRLELSLALLPPDGQPPQPLGDPQVLIDHIQRGSFSYRGVDTAGKPVDWSAQWADGRLLPLLLRIRLQPSGRYDWPLLQIPLRVNPLASISGNGFSMLPQQALRP